MEDTTVRRHRGIPLAHRFFAVVVAVSIALAGCAALIYQSRQYAIAVLTLNPAVIPSIDPGIASARYPAAALAESVLNDETIIDLTREAHLASSSPGIKVGEFRSQLQLTQPSALRLDVRFRSADASQSLAITNAVARALSVWKPVSGATTPRPAPPTESANGAVAVAQTSAAVNLGQSQSPITAPLVSQNPQTNQGPPDGPLSEALGKLGAQLSATDQQLNRLDAGKAQSSGSEQSAHIESREQSLLRAEIREARKSLSDLLASNSKELADPKIGASLNQIQKAVDSISTGGNRNGFNAAGFSTSELTGERSALLRAIGIVSQEARKIHLVEAANASTVTKAKAAAVPSAGTSMEPRAPASSQASSASEPPSEMQEQKIPPPALVPTPGPFLQNPLSIIRLASPAPRPRYWAAIAAGALCGLFYFGIVAVAYRRSSNDDLPSHLSSASHRLITFPDPVNVDRLAVAPADAADRGSEPRQPAAPASQPAPPRSVSAADEKTLAPIVEPSISTTSLATPAEDAVAAAEAAGFIQPLEAATNLSDPGADPESGTPSPANGIPAAAHEVPVREAPSEEGTLSSSIGRKELLAEHRSHIWSAESTAGNDPVAERLRKSLANTATARMFESGAAADYSNGEHHTEESTRDPRADSDSPSDRS